MGCAEPKEKPQNSPVLEFRLYPARVQLQFPTYKYLEFTVSLQQPWAGTALGTFADRAFRGKAAHFVLLLKFFLEI